jgi:hypothetical protein
VNDTLALVNDGLAIDAWSANDPASAPVIDVVATPATAVASPSPVTVPAPLAFANVTVLVSLVTVLPFASVIDAVNVAVSPAVKVLGEPDVSPLADKVIEAGVPGTTDSSTSSLAITWPETVTCAETASDPTTSPLVANVAIPLAGLTRQLAPDAQLAPTFAIDPLP